MRYQLVIVGGGVVGAGLAVALKDLDWKIALVDARLPANNDPRLFGLNYSSCELLKNIGIWPYLAKEASPIQQVHVSKRGQFGAVRLTHEDIDLPTLGHVVKASTVERALNDAMERQSNLTLLRPAELIGMQNEDDEAVLRLRINDSVQEIKAEMVIGADGTESMVRTLMQMPTEIHDYEQQAIVTRTSLQRSHQQIAYERFVDDGAIAMLPLAELECATIWTTSNANASALCALSEHDFLEKLQENFGYRLGRLQAIKARHVFPLRMVKSEQTISGRVMLLGNSAHTLHPIAAQGFNLALYEVATIVAGIKRFYQDECLSNNTLTIQEIHQFSQEAVQQQATSIGFSHQLAQLFSGTSFVNTSLLQLGMVGLDLVRPAKRKLLAQLLGRAGRVPNLLMSNQLL